MWVKCLPHKCGDRHSGPHHLHRGPAWEQATLRPVLGRKRQAGGWSSLIRQLRHTGDPRALGEALFQKLRCKVMAADANL